VVAGFGVPGRAAAEVLSARGFEVTVIELNVQTVVRARQFPMVPGDASDPEVLRSAGAERASVLVVAVPSDPVAIQITRAARALNPGARIITRCHYISTGLECRRLGADEVLVAEQVLAEAISRVLRDPHEPRA
jgi:voltage-gated potassium channel Kch